MKWFLVTISLFNNQSVCHRWKRKGFKIISQCLVIFFPGRLILSIQGIHWRNTDFTWIEKKSLRNGHRADWINCSFGQEMVSEQGNSWWYDHDYLSTTCFSLLYPFPRTQNFHFRLQRTNFQQKHGGGVTVYRLNLKTNVYDLEFFLCFSKMIFWPPLFLWDVTYQVLSD